MGTASCSGTCPGGSSRAVRPRAGAAGRAGRALGPRAGRAGSPRAGQRAVTPALGVVVHEAVVGGGYGRGGPAVPVLERRGLTATAPAEASAAAHESPEASGFGRLGGWLDRVSVPA